MKMKISKLPINERKRAIILFNIFQELVKIEREEESEELKNHQKYEE